MSYSLSRIGLTPFKLKPYSKYVKNKSTEPTLAQSLAPRRYTHTKSHHHFSPLPLKNPGRFTTPVFFSSVTPSPVTTSRISKLPQVIFLIA